VVGGLSYSQGLTLYVTPVVYTYMDSLQSWLGRVFGGVIGTEEAAEAVPAHAGAD
jgi:hypothetical protein